MVSLIMKYPELEYWKRWYFKGDADIENDDILRVMMLLKKIIFWEWWYDIEKGGILRVMMILKKLPIFPGYCPLPPPTSHIVPENGC